MRQDYWQHVEGILSNHEEESPESDKRFWKFIKQQRQEVQDVAPLKSKGKLEDDPVKKANILNAQFQSVFSPRTPLSLKSLCHRAAGFIKRDETACDTPKMPQINITEEGVRKGLERLNPHKQQGQTKLARWS